MLRTLTNVSIGFRNNVRVTKNSLHARSMVALLLPSYHPTLGRPLSSIKYVVHFPTIRNLSYNGRVENPMNPDKYTEQAWNIIMNLPEYSERYNAQYEEAPLMLKSLMNDGKAGLAQRILHKAGIDIPKFERELNSYLAKQPKVSDTSSKLMGSSTQQCLSKANDFKREFGDQFISVEHLVLALADTEGYTKKAFQDAGCNLATLKEAVNGIRGNNKVTSRGAEAQYEALEKYSRHSQDKNLEKVSENERKQLCRLQRLRASLPPSELPRNVKDVATRILTNIVMDVSKETLHLGKNLEKVLKRPIPFDSSNPSKQSVMLELMQSVGNRRLLNNCLARLTTKDSPQATAITLVTGVSGMGKTKIAYDIGMHNAFVVMSRIVEHDNLTPPWAVYHSFAMEVYRSSGTPHDLPLYERESLVAVIILLLGAHLEWALDVSEAAVSEECSLEFQAAVAFKQDGGQENPRLCVLREVVLRAQRNGLAYSHVRHRFQTELCRLLERNDVFGVDSGLRITNDMVMTYVTRTLDRAKIVWGETADRVPCTKIVWAHDEVQALLDVTGYNLIGVFKTDDGDQNVSSQSESNGLFYGFLVALRHFAPSSNSAHLLLGNSHSLAPQMLQ
eukprot:gene14426-30707_t